MRPLALIAPLRHPAVAQLVRYILTGAVTAVLSTSCVLLLSGPAGVAIQLAILASYPLVVTIHFSLQRYFVFADRDRYALDGAAQLRRYLVLVVAHYGCVAGGTALLIRVGPLGDQASYLAALGTTTVITFVVMRVGVFH